MGWVKFLFNIPVQPEMCYSLVGSISVNRAGNNHRFYLNFRLFDSDITKLPFRVLSVPYLLIYLFPILQIYGRLKVLCLYGWNITTYWANISQSIYQVSDDLRLKM